MQTNIFIGNLVAFPVLAGFGDHAVTKFTLIANEYAGKDNEGDTKLREVAIQFTAFRAKAEVLAKHAMAGDQLIVTYRIRNNNYEKDGVQIYAYDFILEDFAFGAPGKAKREIFGNQKLAAQ